MTELVLREDREGLCTLTLNRPEALNALSPNLFVELRHHVDTIAEQTETVGCVILCGKGRSFSAGNDLKAIQAGERAPSRHFQAETLEAIERLPQPVIAAVQGHCYTGALELALACDLLIAAEDARLADTHGKWAMSPSWGMTQRLPRRVGLLNAKEMMFSGRVVGGAEAVTLGLANRCVPAGELLDAAEAMARWLLAHSR
ncbi:MAG: enoyl-CoA hydratase/isomerase family protein, partial [Gammaproteobacteria bacterium]|nr:enoyl-CoA hydratase/isomerase family protein [Gammaproteobacteria bacterium]